jgi:hypothetical protein
MFLLFSLIGSGGHAADRACRALGPHETVRVDFKATPLRDVVRFISCATELNIVLKPSSLGERTVTVIAPRPVKAADLMPLLSAGLRHIGLVAERRGAYLLIRPDPAHLPSKRRSSSGR